MTERQKQAKEKREAMKEMILKLIPKGKHNRVNLSYIRSMTGLTARTVKSVISELRIEYPICAIETEGGGYWIAESDVEIKEFVEMIARRRDGYNHTINIMLDHVGDV